MIALWKILIHLFILKIDAPEVVGEKICGLKEYILLILKNMLLDLICWGFIQCWRFGKEIPGPTCYWAYSYIYKFFYFKDIIVDNCQTLINAKGLPESPIEELTFENL